MEITKLKAAENQLNTGIELFFTSPDPVSPYTLIHAAHEILMNIGRTRGVESHIKEKFLRMIVPARRKEFLRKINAAPNFFKHAGRDPSTTLEFKPEQIEFLAWDACIMFRDLIRRESHQTIIFKSWFYMKNSDLITDSGLAAKYSSAAKNIRIENKKDFYEDFLRTLMGI